MQFQWGSSYKTLLVAKCITGTCVAALGAAGKRHGGAHQGEYREGAPVPAEGEGAARPGGGQAHRRQNRLKGTVFKELHFS